jgi:hypothetical protein
VLELLGIRLSANLFWHRLRLDDKDSVERLVLGAYAPRSESERSLHQSCEYSFPNVTDLSVSVRQASYGPHHANWAEFIAKSVRPSRVRCLALNMFEVHVYGLLAHFDRVSDLTLKLDCETARWDGVLTAVRDQCPAVTRLDVSGAMLFSGCRVVPPGLREKLAYFRFAGCVIVPPLAFPPAAQTRTASCSVETVGQRVWPWPK